jgi:DNA-binding CsgD family transcriptional regulator
MANAGSSGKLLARMHDPKVKRLREDTAMRLYAQGHSQEDIAEIMGTSQGAVSGAISRGLARYAKDNKIMADRARALITQRLELMFRSWFPLATGDNPTEKAAKIILDVLDRLAKLSGVGDLAATVNINVTTANADMMRAEITRDLDALAERQQKIIEGVFDEPDAAQ